MIITFMKELASKGIECAIVCHLDQFPPVIISSMLALCWFDCWTMTFSSFLSPRSGMRKNDALKATLDLEVANACGMVYK